MFDKVSRPQIYAYDGITDKYLGKHVFKITPEVENILLDYVDNGKKQDQVVFRDVYFYPNSADYTMPLPYKKYSRRGVLRAVFRDQNSLQWIPIEICARFYIMARVRPEEGQCHFDSMEYSDIVVEGMSVLTEHIFDPNI
ncbi:MAG: hypothetical protein VB071_00540 [Lawsonibacter sp.]|nr:hypothetical protein [Lawsonibacter sp.]